MTMQRTFASLVLAGCMAFAILVPAPAHAQMNGQVGCTDNPSCCPFTETHHNTCGNGSDGEIVIQRTVNGCGGDTGWVQIGNTCGCVEAYEPPVSVACTAPQTGTILRHRLANVGGNCGAYGGWENITSTCSTAPPTCEQAGNCPVVDPGPQLDIFMTQDTEGNSLYFISKAAYPGRGADEVLLNQDNALHMCASSGYTKVIDFGGAWNGKWKGKGDCGNSDIDLYRWTFQGNRNDPGSVTNLGNYSKAFIKGKDTNCESWVQSALCAKEAIPEARLTQTVTVVDDPSSVPAPSGYGLCPADLDLRYGLTSTKYFATAPARTVGSQQGITASRVMKDTSATQFNPFIQTACRYRFSCYQKTSGPEEPYCMQWDYDEWMGGSYCSYWSEPSGKTQVTLSTLNCN